MILASLFSWDSVDIVDAFKDKALISIIIQNIGNEKSDFYEKLLELTQEFEIKIQKETEKTFIHKINIKTFRVKNLDNYASLLIFMSNSLC